MTIEDLVGLEVSAVAFVRDYVELNFDGPVLRLLGTVTVQLPEQKSEWPGPGARDSLCGLIGNTVTSVSASDDSIVIALDGNIRIATSAQVAQPEFAHFVPGENLPIAVW